MQIFSVQNYNNGKKQVADVSESKKESTKNLEAISQVKDQTSFNQNF